MGCGCSKPGRSGCFYKGRLLSSLHPCLLCGRVDESGDRIPGKVPPQYAGRNVHQILNGAIIPDGVKIFDEQEWIKEYKRQL